MYQILLDRSNLSIWLQLLQGLATRWLKSVAIAAAILVFTCLLSNPAWAGIEDDKYDGNVFVLYAGNGSLVPAKTSLADSLKANKPALIVFYIDDSTDCKKYSTTISQLQGYYGKAASFIPVTVDSLALDKKYPQTEAGYYYGGTVPQTVVVDKNGKVQLNEVGVIPFEKVDDAMRNVFDLLPRKDSIELKRRSFNEFNSELAK
jgi:Thioredoxin-like domain